MVNHWLPIIIRVSISMIRYGKLLFTHHNKGKYLYDKVR